MTSGSLVTATRFFLARIFAVALIFCSGDIGASFSHESLGPAGQRSIAATSAAQTALRQRDPAQFFTINKILGNNSRPSLHLSAANDEPFGKTAFVQPEGQISTKWHEIQVDLAEKEPILKECFTDRENARPQRPTLSRSS